MRLSAAVALTIAVLGAAAWALRPPGVEEPCRLAAEPARLTDLVEVSGVAVSRRHPGVLWVHNDSGNEPVLFGLEGAGTARARVRLPVNTRDWEDISAAPCPGGDCLYIADIGDNAHVRRRVFIYRIPEPALDDTVVRHGEAFTVSYADGPHNAEALFATDTHLFIVTKDNVGALYRSPLPLNGVRELVFERVGELGVPIISDAETSPDGRVVAVRNPSEVLFYRTAELARGGTPQPVARVSVSALREPQGEGVALGSDGVVYLTSEGGSWSRAGLLTTMRCSIEAST